jgi:hypothetical protein
MPFGSLGRLFKLGKGARTASLATKLARTAQSARGAYVALRAAIAGGRGAWKLGPIARGVDLEGKALAAQGGRAGLRHNYPTIDAYNRGRITNVKSVDLQAASRRDPRRLSSYLRREIDKTAKFKPTAELAGRPVTSRELRVVVEPGAQSIRQRMAFGRLRRYANKQGVDLNVQSLR